MSANNTPTCHRCGAVLPLDSTGHPRYWQTYYISPQTRIPTSVHVCAACRSELHNQPVNAQTATRQPALF